MEEILKEIDKLHLDYLSEEWIESIFASEFLEYAEMPNDYEVSIEYDDIKFIFLNIINAVQEWLNNNPENGEDKSWTQLSPQIKHQNLLALLGYFIDFGGKNILTREHRNNAILASRLYYKLLCIPGYKAYHIYHSQLFTQSLLCLNYPKAVCINENNYFNTKELTCEVNSLIKELGHFVYNLREIIPNLHLSPNDMNFEDIVSNLLDITGGAIVNKLHIDKVELANLSGTIYEMIDILICQTKDEPNSTAILLIFKCLLPKFIAASTDSRSANNVVRASYVTYSGILLSKYGKAALPGFNILLQHLCYTLDGLERAEVRFARVSLVVGLMSLLPHKSYRNFVNWLLKLSTTAKVSHRLIALEILAKLLNNDSDQFTNKETTLNESYNIGKKKLECEPTPEGENTAEPQARTSTDSVNTESESEDLPDNEETEDAIAGLLRQRAHTVAHGEVLRAVYERVHDASGSLRMRALALLADCLLSDHPPMKRAIEELNGAGSVSRLAAASARGVCDERAAVRKAAAVLLQRLAAAALRGGRAPRDSDYAMLVGLCRDASIVVRSAALSALGELVACAALSPIATTVPLLPPTESPATPSSPVTTTERLGTPTKCLTTPTNCPATPTNCPSTPTNCPATPTNCPATPTNCPSTPTNCPSTHARTSATSDEPHDAASDPPTVTRVALDAFLAGPMHRLSDPETKIQEQVVGFIKDLLIDPLRKYDPLVSEDTLPWEFLSGITRHNMKRHLQKACGLLVKSSNCINHRLVDILSTHLGTSSDERDLQCLVLLTSVARHVDYSDVGFLLDYYYHLTAKQERDARLLPLTLELLSVWSGAVAGAARDALRDHLVTRLAAAPDDESRPAVASLAAQLDPNNLHWATELMQISERRALASSDVREWLRAADVSLVAPTPPSPQLLRLFLTALAHPPPEWGPQQRGACSAGAGRLCVRSRAAAAALAPPLAAQLRDAAAPLCARLNALLALTDICTRYSCIVEPQLDAVCGSVARGAAPALRRAAARALTRLLLAGYLRLRTPLYYRYCALLADDDHDVREPAEYYVSCCLTVDAIYHHFVDCVLHYNNEDTEPMSFDARQLIYDVMLQRLSLVQKLNVQCRLAREVLEHAASLCDEQDELPAALHAALLDTITLLCGPRMKLPKKPEKAGDADLDDLQERVTTNIVSHIFTEKEKKMKRTVAEVLVPAVLRLYAHMRPRGGQLAAYLVRIATDLLNDYRHEIEELIENDEELVERVRQFQETIGLEASFGNARNLVTASAPPEPDTPRARRRPAPRTPGLAPRKRALRV
ncbi:uncharacterized protein LOC123656001 [Melitaea cinxia]|uniref:uncharacterized protein LOC123656001 n=1 Tax=Melitaea cinxia TaxID=113334 RepID=UPI001E2724E3|nr:uncharacterized protein LOC123656001 [Melitaea cinxia]